LPKGPSCCTWCCRPDLLTAGTARVADVKRITDGIATIGQEVNKLAVSRSRLNKVYNDTLDNLRMTDAKYLSVMRAASFLEQKKANVSKEVIQLAVTVADCKDRIAKNMVMINQLRSQKAKSDGVLDPSTLTYIQSLGQDAHRDLRKFLYYVVKAYEYYTLAPWDQSYLTAQKTFEDLSGSWNRRISTSTSRASPTSRATPT
jgi:hypothetical protein